MRSETPARTRPAAGRRLRRACIAAALAATVALPAAADVTHIAVRFRDAAAGTTSAADLARLADIGQAVRTGLAGVAVTVDGAYRVALAPALSDDGAKAALARLRMDPGVVYADPVADPSLPAARAKRTGPQPRLSRIIVKYRDASAVADAAADLPLAASRVAQLSARAGRPLAHGRTIAWARAHVLDLMQKLPVDDVEAIAAAIAQDPDVEWAHPDYLVFRQLVPNDPLYASQWHYWAPPPGGQTAVGGANLPGAWDRTTGWSGVRTAVIDSGALKTHPDLANRFIGGYDFIVDWLTANDGDPPQPGGCSPNQNPFTPPCVSSRDADASDPGDWITTAENAGSTNGGWFFQCGVSDSSWHGTHVAGTVGAATGNAAGVAGVNWVSRIVPIRALGKCGGFTSDIADAIEWSSGGPVTGVPANGYPARVLNMSLGGPGVCPALTQTAITNALGRNVAVIVAAGNENDDAANYSPSSCNGVLTVAAVGRIGQRASYSNFGAVVELAAPGGSDGERVLSTLNSGTTVPLPGGMNYVGYQGTSMATPHVAGIASLLLSLKPSLTPAQVTSILQATARPFPTGTGRDCLPSTCGTGIVDAAAALNNVATTGGPGGTPLIVPAVTLGSSSNPATVGASITLTASVTGTAPGGTVAFTVNDVAFAACAAVALTGAGNTRTAQCVTNALPAGTHMLRAAYSGSTTHTPGDSAILHQAVVPTTPQPTTTSVASSLNPSNQGQSVTFTATVTGIAPGGSVDFRANGASIAGCAAVALPGPGDVRIAQCTTSALPAGSIAIQALYSGNASNLPSSGSLTQGVIGPNACAGFNDVDAASPFCSSVQWMSNREITSGCAPGAYCPDSAVSRLAMAAFMFREGRALTPEDLARVSAQGTLNLSGSAMVACFDPARNYAVTAYPRRARLQAFANVFSASVSSVISIQPAYSMDGGTNWTPIPSSAVSASIYTGRTPDDDRTVVVHGELDLAVGQSYLFGLIFSGAPAPASLGYYCTVQTRIHNRNGASAPF